MPTVLITGSNRGLGLEFARQYLREGWQVLATCRNPSSAGELSELADGAGGKLSVYAMEVTDSNSIQRAAAHFKDVAIDLLINSAGIIGVSGRKAGAVDYDSWARVLNVNTMGPLRVTEAFIEHLGRSEWRVIVTITSGMGSLAENTSGGSIPYRSSKAAVNMVMRSLAIELAPRRILCVVINPGWVKTDMGGPGATLTPEQSVTAMRRVIETLTPERSGRFFNYDGTEYPW
jgi:NAD(P)-dependent dehydrogenase (short-subunit alcohol dehydrogenase family)